MVLVMNLPSRTEIDSIPLERVVGASPSVMMATLKNILHESNRLERREPELLESLVRRNFAVEKRLRKRERQPLFDVNGRDGAGRSAQT